VLEQALSCRYWLILRRDLILILIYQPVRLSPELRSTDRYIADFLLVNLRTDAPADVSPTGDSFLLLAAGPVGEFFSIIIGVLFWANLIPSLSQRRSYDPNNKLYNWLLYRIIQCKLYFSSRNALKTHLPRRCIVDIQQSYKWINSLLVSTRWNFNPTNYLLQWPNRR